MPAKISGRLVPPKGVSTFQFNKLLDAFAAGEAAYAVASRTSLPYHRARRVYELIRRRLIEIGYIPSIEVRLSRLYAEDGDEDAFDRRIAALTPEMNKRHGVTDATCDEHIAELLFREEEMHVQRAYSERLDRVTDMRRAFLFLPVGGLRWRFTAREIVHGWTP